MLGYTRGQFAAFFGLIAVVVGFDNQPVRRNWGDLAVIVKVRLVDVAVQVARDAVIASVRGDEPGAGDTSNSELTEHRFAANRFSNIHPQHPARRN